jgi:hypothetical protein
MCVEILNKSKTLTDSDLSNHIISSVRDLNNVTADENHVCVLDNITIIPGYRTGDSLSYQVSRCNYCGKEWGEFWVCYKYILSSLISATGNANSEEST